MDMVTILPYDNYYIYAKQSSTGIVNYTDLIEVNNSIGVEEDRNIFE